MHRRALDLLTGPDDVYTRVDAPRISVPRGGITVGDWVVLHTTAGATKIRRVLERRSLLERVGPDGRVQALAANVDYVFICFSVDQPISTQLVERFLTSAHGSGATPVVLLTKADLTRERQEKEKALRSVCLATSVHTVSAFSGEGVEVVLNLAHPNKTLTLIGPSGVGKTTLVNRMTGLSLATGEVGPRRLGRHTTTKREMVSIPSGGVIIDTPGLRTMVPTPNDEGLAATFPEITERASLCRFRDCSHRSEPGCAVQAAIAEGTIEPRRLEHWRALKEEMERAASGRRRRG